jgi:hypothetical protein
MSKEAGARAPSMTAFAGEIAAALDRAVGNKSAGVKTVTGWTGANERTVKNWFAGRYAPNGHHLVTLARHSDDVMETVLALSGRKDLLAAQRLHHARTKILDALVILTSALDDADMGRR